MTESAKTKRIAFVSHTTELTGAAMSFYTLLSGLDSERFSCFPLLPDDGPMFQTLTKDGYEPCIVPFSGWSKLTSVSKAKAYLKAQQVDLVYLSCAHKFTRMVGKAAHALNIPVVWHVREPPLGNRVQKSIRYMKKFGANVVVVSQEQKCVLESKVKVRKVDNGVDISRYDISINGDAINEKYGLAESDFVYGIVGTIEKRKNTELFLRAAESIAKDHKQARFLVIGSGKKEYLDTMKELVSSSPELKDSVTFTGSVWNVPEMMARLDVLVMPSNWEAFPRVVIEGMTMGKPVIASDVGDVSYIIDDEVNGFVVPARDLEAFTKTMDYCIENPGRLEDISAKAHTKAIENFTQEIHVAKMEAILEEASQP